MRRRSGGGGGGVCVRKLMNQIRISTLDTDRVYITRERLCRRGFTEGASIAQIIHEKKYIRSSTATRAALGQCLGSTRGAVLVLLDLLTPKVRLKVSSTRQHTTPGSATIGACETA